MSWIDLLVLFIIAFYIMLDFKRGLVQSLASVLSFVISLVVASALYKSAYTWVVERTGIYDLIYQIVEERFPSVYDNGFVLVDVEKLPIAVQKVVEDLINGTTAAGIRMDLAASLTDMILYALCFLGVFLLVRILIFVVAGMLDFIAKLPGLNVMNKFGGLLVGVIEGAIISLIAVNALYTLSILFKMESIINALNNSSLAHYFYIGYLFI